MQSYSLTAATGAIGAALGADSAVFAMRAASIGRKAIFTNIELDFAVSTAFTTVTVAGRRLEVQRGSGANASGGNAVATATKRVAQAASIFDAAAGGDARVATTAALTVAGITFEDLPLYTMHLAAIGAVNATKHDEFGVTDFDPTRGPIGGVQILPGELLVVRNQAAMDAAGVWSLGIHLEWVEVSL